jgi:hypothetical protein
MRMMVPVLAAGLASLAAAQDDIWISVGRTDKAAWQVKAGSGTVTEVQGAPVVVVVGRMITQATNRTTVQKWYVSVSDCERGMGQVVALTLDDRYQYRQPFVLGDESAPAGLARHICDLPGGQ